MKIAQQICLLSVLISLTSCGGTIEIVNNTNSVAYMEKEFNYTDGNKSNKRFKIQPRGVTVLTGYKTNWTRKSIVHYYGDVSILKLVSVTDTVVLKNQSEIVEYLLDHRKGVFNQNIVLDIGEK